MPRHVIDIAGRTFARWTVIKRAPKTCQDPTWICRCECGAEAIVYAKHLKSGRSTQCQKCGSNRLGRLAHGATVGRQRPTEYRIWKGIRTRCYNPNCKEFRHYGGRGIFMCEAWRASYAAFFADMGPRPSTGHSIDRIDNDGPYAPDNCRWATRQQQEANKRGKRVAA